MFQSFFSMIQVMFVCGTLLTIAFFIMLSLPDSKLRSFCMPIIGWGMAILCGIYAISPIDIVPEAFFGPFGLVDDLGAVVGGIMAARTAMSAANRQTEEYEDE